MNTCTVSENVVCITQMKCVLVSGVSVSYMPICLSNNWNVQTLCWFRCCLQHCQHTRWCSIKPCPHWRLQSPNSATLPNSATVTEFSATVAVFVMSVLILGNCLRFRGQSPFSVTVAKFGDKYIVAEIGDYSRQCGQGLRVLSNVFSSCLLTTQQWAYLINPIKSINMSQSRRFALCSA